MHPDDVEHEASRPPSEEEPGQDDPPALGWEAIDRALAPLYAGQEPKHWGTLISCRLGGPDPLDGVSAYKRLEPVPHWHFVTYGFSELYEKDSDNTEISGWGFELTLRLATDAGSDEPPIWAVVLLQGLARYVFQSGNVLDAGDYMNLNGPMGSEDTLLRSVLFTPDPELPAIDTPHGRVEFLQVVGITDDEERAAKQWTTGGLLEILAEKLPLLVTDLGRGSVLDDPAVRARVDAGAARDGSRTGVLLVPRLGWEERRRLLRSTLLHLTLGAQALPELRAVLPGRISFGRDLRLVGEGLSVTLKPSESNAWRAEGTSLVLELRPETAREICAVPVKEGEHPVRSFDGLVLKVAGSTLPGADDRT